MNRKIDCSFLVLLAVVLVTFSGTARAGLVGHWTFDEGSGTVAHDSSGNGNDGTFVGDPQWVPGYVGGALEFNGDDYVNCGNTPSLNVRNQITMLFWFKVEAFQNTWEAFLAKGDGAYRASRSAGTGNATHMGITSGNYFDGTVIVTDNQWHHYAGTYDGTEARIYIDGVLDTARTYGGQIGDSSGYDLYLGENAQATGRFFHGLLDDVRIYDRALTEEQIVGLVENGIEPAWVKAEKPNPADGTTGVMIPLFQWTPGETALFDAVYLGTTPELTEADKVLQQMSVIKMYYHTKFPLLPGETYYWRVDAIEADQTVHTGNVWSFTVAPLAAFSPSPRDDEKWIATDAELTWQPGQGAIGHDVYFGTDGDAVAGRDASVFKGKLLATSFDPGGMQQETTYYWLVDEYASDGTKYEGSVWSFTTIGPEVGVKAEYFNGMTPQGTPVLTVIEDAIDHNWGDPGGPGDPVGVDSFSARWTADLEIALADTYTFITTTDDGVRLWLDGELIIENWTDHASTDDFSAPIALEPGIYPLRMEWYENGGGAVAQLSWQTPTMARQIIPAGPLQLPVRAKPVYPTNGAVDVRQDVTLRWSAGEKAVTHEVYFGDDEAAVAAGDAGAYQGSQALDETTSSPGVLEWNKTYYWRIDEVNAVDPQSPWKGGVMRFTTADFIVVDDFESYTDDMDAGEAIWQTWIDGLTNLTGSIVGYFEAPFAEQTIVNGGNQSMPFDYNNIVSPYYSEAELPLDPAQDWTVEGVSDLTLFVRGYPAPVAVEVTVTGGKMSLTGAGADIWGNSDEFTYAYKTLNGNGSIIARVVSNGTGSNNWAKGGVMIRDSLDGGSTHAMMVITGGDGNGASFQWRPLADNASSNSDAATPVAPPYWVMIERIGDGLTGYLSADGKNWTLQGSTQYIAMSGPVYIGICVTSHAAGEDRTFEFDNIQTTGGVSGAWQGAIISAPRHNASQSLYVVVEDSSGKSGGATNRDLVASVDWTEWKIPLSSFGGVNLSRVSKLYIGVGDRDNPTPDGDGRIFIDDIRVIKPEPEPAE